MQINEIFYSISGEGQHAGIPAIFIRTNGCNLRCTYCDSVYTFGSEYTNMDIADIIERCRDFYPCRYVVLTGGEPLLQKEVNDLIFALADAGYYGEIETNGAVEIDRTIPLNWSYTMDWKCPSSGMHDKMLEDNLRLLRLGDTLKFVVGSKEDLSEAKRIIDQHLYNLGVEVFLSPVFGQIEPKEIVEFILENKLVNARMQLQIHKFIWPADMRGV